MTAARHPICVLTGCTAVGKTQFAVDWAESLDAEIVSCDSLLFYRGMNIGTAKPTAEELSRVRHHLVDIVDVSGRMDVKTYVRLAREAILEIGGRGKRVLVTGGSGFYLKAFFAAVADDVESDITLKEELETDLEKKGLSALVDRLAKLNPAGLGDLDLRNPRRVVRALERCLVSRKTLEELARQFASQPAPFADFEIELVEITRESDDLRKRIKERIAQMLAAGLVEEVCSLKARGLETNRSASSAIGYREVLASLETGMGQDALLDQIAVNTWRLVRKQRTWFRTQLPPHRCVEAAVAEQEPIGDLFA